MSTISLNDFHGPNAGYVLALYERYQQDPQAVDAQTRALFEGWTPDGEAILFSSARDSVTQRHTRFFTVDRNGGYPTPSCSEFK